MVDNKTVISKAFIMSVFTSILLCFLLNECSNFIPCIVQSIILAVLLEDIIIRVIFILLRSFNVRNKYKGKSVGIYITLFEELYVKFRFITFLIPIVMILVLVNPSMLETL